MCREQDMEAEHWAACPVLSAARLLVDVFSLSPHDQRLVISNAYATQ